MRCINCYNTIPGDVEFCPSCSFPIFRPKAAAAPQPDPAAMPADQAEAEPAPADLLASLDAVEPKPTQTMTRPVAVAARPRPSRTMPNKGKRALPRRPGVETRAEKVRKVIGGIFATVAVAGILFYALKSSGFIRAEPDPKAALEAIDKVRSLQSSQAGLTVDQAMTKMMDNARSSGTLVAFQGWTVRQVSGDSGKARVTFSFVEKAGRRQADFLVDLSNTSITPENDLAASVYKR